MDFLKVPIALLLLVLGNSLAAEAANLNRRLDALDDDIVESRNLAGRSGVTLEKLRAELYDAAYRARDAKRDADAIQVGLAEGNPAAEELGQLREDLVQVGMLLRNFRDQLNEYERILGDLRDEVIGNAKALDKLRSGPEIPVEVTDEIRTLRTQLYQANRTIAAYSARMEVANTREQALKATDKVPPPFLGEHPLSMGYEALAVGRIDDAAVAFSAALNRNPGSHEARLGLASCHYEKGELDAARLLVDEVLAVANEHALALGLDGMIRFREGDLRGARRSLEMAVRLDEFNPAFHSHLGVVLRHLHRGNAATASLARAVELDPHYAPGLYNLAVLLATSPAPDLESARAYYNRFRQVGGPASEALEILLAGP